MPDSKITALTSISTSTDPANDPLVIVDVSDTSMAATGTTKKVTLNQLLATSPTATLASATITGDLTVDTSTLKVDSANNRVGIGTASPTYTLHLADTSASSVYIRFQNSTLNNGFIGYNSSNALEFLTGGVEQYRIAPLGVFNWYDGAGGTRMTLNATGLGVGVVPNQKFVCAGPRSYFAGGGAVYGIGIGFNTTRTAADHVFFLGATDSATPDLVFSGASGAALMRLDAAGNVGIGVTPSAWSAVKALDIVSSGASIYGSGAAAGITANAFFDGSVWKYKSGSAVGALHYQQSIGPITHAWYVAPAGTGTISSGFTNAAMTLDASGNLGVGVVAAAGIRTQFKGSATSTQYTTQCINSSDKLSFGVRNDGLIITGSPADVATLPNAPYNLTTGSAANLFVDSIGVLYRSTSSIKYKTDIADSTRGLADVLKLRPVTYKAKNSGDTVFGGLIAEEVDAAGLTEFVQYAPDNTPDAIYYGNMVSLLVAAIKELTARVQTLETH